MSIILGISSTHNGGVALICDGEVKSAIQAERISRLKRQDLPPIWAYRRCSREKIELVHKSVRYCLDASGFQYQDIDAIALSTSWEVEKINTTVLFQYIGGVPKNYIETFYVPHHLAHMEYIVHYGDLEPGIVLVIDGSGSFEVDRLLFNVEEEHHPQIINHIQSGGKEGMQSLDMDLQRLLNTGMINRKQAAEIAHTPELFENAII